MTPEEQREVSRCVFREANDVFLVVDPLTQRILEVNPAAQRLTGYRRRALLEMTVDDVLICEESSERDLLSAACRSTKFATCSDACQVITVTGKTVEVQTHACRIHTEPRSLGLFVLRDTSRQRAAEQEKRALETKIHESRRMESLGLMASGIAHDLNNQLLGILGNAELILRSLPETDPRHANIVEITAAANKTAELTHNLLAYANTEHRQQRDVAVESILHWAVSDLDTEIRRAFELTINVDPALRVLVSDPLEIQQAIQNILTNSAEAIHCRKPAVGKVQIQAGRHRVDLKQGTNLSPGSYVEISVADNGMGITAEELPFVFDPFFSRKLAGRGLGLAVAHSALLMNGGLIQVRSQPDIGSEFRLLLPEAPPVAVGTQNATGSQVRSD